MIVSVHDWTNSCNRASSADGRADGNQKRRRALYGESAPEEQATTDSKTDSDQCVQEANSSGVKDFSKAHAEAKPHNGDLEQPLGRAGGEFRERIAERQ